MKPGELVAKLRSERGLTQPQLAARIGKTTSTVVRVELGTGTWPTSTARKVFEVLNEDPLTKTEAYAFLDQFGLSRSLYDAAPLPPSAQAPRSESEHQRSVQTTSEALQLLSQLFEHFGPAGTVEQLRRLLPGDEGEEGITIVHPPGPSKKVPGAIEQEIVRYKPAAKSASAIKRATKATRAS